MNPIEELMGGVYLVTGGAGGLGQGICEAISEADGWVAIAGIDGAAAEAAAREFDHTGRTALGLECDVSSDESVATAMAAIVEHFGHLDGVVNNAGVIRMNDARDTTSEEWVWQFDVNVTGVLRVCRAAVDLLADSSMGAVVNVSSNCGKVGFPSMAAYNASKAAVISLTRTLAVEWAPLDVNVNAVCPGAVDTPMLADVSAWIGRRTGRPAKEILNGIYVAQLGRKIKPVEVGRVVAFLLSPTARIIRGQSINVDAGETPY